jgi:hypothetical protein
LLVATHHQEITSWNVERYLYLRWPFVFMKQSWPTSSFNLSLNFEWGNSCVDGREVKWLNFTMLSFVLYIYTFDWFIYLFIGFNAYFSSFSAIVAWTNFINYFPNLEDPFLCIGLYAQIKKNKRIKTYIYIVLNVIGCTLWKEFNIKYRFLP